MPTQPAILGPARLGNFRLGYLPAALRAVRETRIRVYIAGVLATGVRREGMTIRDVVNETPSTLTFLKDGTAPEAGQAIRVTINFNAPRLLFAGVIQTVVATYEAGNPANRVWSCTAIDDLAKLERRRPFGTWTSTSATTVAQALIASYAPGFSAAGVQAGLPPITITLDGSEGWDGALKQIAAQIGGYFYVEDGVVHLFQTEATDAPDDIDGSPQRPFTEPAVTVERDLSQLRTRVYGRGHGEATPTDVGISETILPIANATMFNTAGGKAIADTQRLDYTGVQAGGAGSLVGPAATPSAALNAAVAVGAGIDVGAHDYAYTWATAAGETLPSPIKSLLIGAPTTPANAPSVAATGSNLQSSDLHVGDFVNYSYSWSTASSINDLTQESARSPEQGVFVVADPTYPFLVAAPSVVVEGTTDARVKWIRIWKSVNGGARTLTAIFAQKGIANTPGSVYAADGGVFADVHSAATLNRAALSGIAVGPTGTTSRKLYRTVAGGSQLKLLATIGDNTTTTATDSTADAGLGANAPVADTSGLTTASGQINAGSTSILTASAAAFSSAGGWAIIGAQAVRYTGVTGNTLTGIPASGPGALASSVRYGEHVDPSPALTGVTGIAAAIPKGTTVNIWVQRDDGAAQAAQAAIDGGDGIYEFLVSDERRGETSLIAMADANLALYSRPIVTVRYTTNDVKTKSGKPVVISLPALDVDETLTIQDVTITNLDFGPATPPLFTVTASSVRVSFEALMRGLLEGTP